METDYVEAEAVLKAVQKELKAINDHSNSVNHLKHDNYDANKLNEHYQKQQQKLLDERDQ